MTDETKQKVRSEYIQEHTRRDCIRQEGDDPSLSVGIPKARGRVWAGTDTGLTVNEEMATIPRQGDEFK